MKINIDPARKHNPTKRTAAVGRPFVVPIVHIIIIILYYILPCSVAFGGYYAMESDALQTFADKGV